MATRDTEGRREIEAARQRLSAAKSHETFVSKAEDTAKQMFDTAKKNLKDIQLQSISSKKEVEDAQRLLKEAEKRWEVIEIDLDDHEDNAGVSTNKKRKLSVVSPQGSDNNNKNTNQTTNSNGDTNNEDSVTVTIPYQSGRKLGLMLSEVCQNQVRMIILSYNSAVFKFKDQLLLERGKRQDGALDDDDELIEWGKKDDNVPPFQTIRDGLLPLSEFNSESMKLAINGTINPRLILEEIRYRTGTFLARHNRAINVAKILQDPQNYPLDITFRGVSMTNINEIEVQGAGSPGANGIYKRDIDRRGYPSFVKRGRWQGGNDKFVIFRDYGLWKIGLLSIGRDLYAGGNTELPRKTGWLGVSSGEEPAPTLQY